MDILREILLPRLEGVRMSGGSWMARCPAAGHEDSTASLHISRGDTHPVVLTCHAGCERQDILAALGFTWDDLCSPKDSDEPGAGEWTPNGPAIAVYDYTDEEGTLLYQVVRAAGKKFSQRVPDRKRKTGWRWKLGDTRRVLYRLPKVIEALRDGEMIYVCYADDTEVLTPSGWELMAKLPEETPVAQYDAGAVSFVTPSAHQVFDYAGPMVAIDADWSGLLVTPDHRVLCAWRGSRPVTIRAEDVKAQRWLPVAGRRQGDGFGPTPAEARLLAAWQADGVNCARGYRAAWNLRKDRKKDRLRHLLRECGLEWREQEFESTQGWTYFTVDRREAAVLSELPEKRFAWHMLDWPLNAREALLDELGFWDGDRTGVEGVRYFTADEQCAEVVSAIAATSSWGSITRRDDREERPEQGPQWVVNLVPRDWRTLRSARPGGLRRSRLLPDRAERLPRHARAGKVTVCGNCEGEKDVHAIEAAGATATCNSGGAGKWQPEFAEVLRDAIVVIIADKDEPGQAHARQVRASLAGIAAASEIVEAAGECKDAADHLADGRTLAEFEVTTPADDGEKPDLAPDLYEFLAVVDPPDEWVIPGILERGDRLIWTGYEGLGKSVLTRQLAVCAAAGIHPFTDEEFEPQRVLYIDCENPDRKSRRHFRKLERIARWKGRAVPEGILRILQRPAGVDLTREAGAAWLLERVTAHKPDLLVVGPLYRLHAADTNEESAARTVVAAIDAARIRADCALITEAHAGHGEAALNRSVRPAGSSLFLRWPEFGYGIKPLGDADDNGHHRSAAVVTWRGPREERHWPKELCWGDGESDWPWIVPNMHPQVRAARNSH